MKITLFSRYNEREKWGGDIEALRAIAQGMRSLGCDAEVISDFRALNPSDALLLSNTCLDLREQTQLMKLLSLPFSLIGFHEDRIKYDSIAFGFYRYLQGCLGIFADSDIAFSIEALIENPSIAYYFGPPPRKTSLYCYEALKHARVCIANSETEARTMRRDCPPCTAHVVPLAPGAAVDFPRDPTDAFLRFTDLPSNGYLLQVGRMEPRKNQLATILATRDLPLPLVFIATQGDPEYQLTCHAAILKYRKAPTVIISQSFDEMNMGPLKIVRMPQREKLSLPLLHSAYAHAALNIHPAFMELPGYTYLESAICGTPTIASSWATVSDYFASTPLDDRIAYCLPYDIAALSNLIKAMLGKRYPIAPMHPVFQRTREDMARDILALIV